MTSSNVKVGDTVLLDGKKVKVLSIYANEEFNNQTWITYRQRGWVFSAPLDECELKQEQQ